MVTSTRTIKDLETGLIPLESDAKRTESNLERTQDGTFCRAITGMLAYAVTVCVGAAIETDGLRLAVIQSVTDQGPYGLQKESWMALANWSGVTLLVAATICTYYVLPEEHRTHEGFKAAVREGYVDDKEFRNWIIYRWALFYLVLWTGMMGFFMPVLLS